MNKDKSGSLEELLLFDNFQILGTPFRFAEVIYKREGVAWNEAQRKASGLIKANAGWNYLEDLRQRMNRDSHSLTTTIHQPIETISTETEQITITNQPAETPKPDTNLFEENYLLLTRFAPELEEELPALTEKSILSGKSVANLHGSTSIQSTEKDKYGYYLILQINESTKPEQRIWLFVNTTAKTVQALSCEINGEKFEVYNDIHIRDMLNPQQLELQNEHLNQHLQRLISRKLTIPTIGIVPIEEPTVEVIEEVQEDTNNYPVYSDPLSDAIKAHLQGITEKNYPFDKYDEDDDDEPDIDELLEENEALREENEELKKDSEFVEQSLLPALYSQNFKLLRLLIPDLPDELDLKSFTVLLEPEKQANPTFKIRFIKAKRIIFCDASEVDPTGTMENPQCLFVIRDKKEVQFEYFDESFFVVKEEMHFSNDAELSEYALKGNSALFNFFVTLLFHHYKSTVTERVYLPEVVGNTPPEIHKAEVVEERQESDGTAETLAAVLATVGLGILGFKLLKP